MTGRQSMDARSTTRPPSARTAPRAAQRRPGSPASTSSQDAALRSTRLGPWRRQTVGEFKLRHGDYTAYVIRARLALSMETYWTFCIIRLRKNDLIPVAYFFPVAHGHRKTLRGAKKAATRLLASLDAVTEHAGLDGNPAP